MVVEHIRIAAFQGDCQIIGGRCTAGWRGVAVETRYGLPSPVGSSGVACGTIVPDGAAW